MPLFSPIRGLRPVPDMAGEVAELPYDVMDRQEARAMAAGRPHSFLHVSRPDIDLPDGVPAESPQAYALADEALARLRAEGVLVPDRTEQFHVYRMSHEGHEQVGIVGGASVAAYDSDRIRRHELTRPAKQEDRARHIEAVRAQTGPVLLVHRPDPTVAAVVRRQTAGPPKTAVLGPGGVHHELWPIQDPAEIAELVAAFDMMPRLYIADGHHRSAAASVVHQRARSANSGMLLAVAFPTDQVRILAYNRLVRLPPGMDASDLMGRLAETFDVQAADRPVLPARRGEFGIFVAGSWWRFTAPDRLRDGAEPADRLDVAVLQSHLLGPVLGIPDPRIDPRLGFIGGIRPVTDLEAAVDSGSWDAAIAVHPTSVSDLLDVADGGGIMPPKSTWFEPKLLDGLVSLVLD